MDENPVEARWLATQSTLRTQLGDAQEVSCLIPHWEPVDLAMGLRWLQATIYEGYYVKYSIARTGQTAVVTFRQWEFGEEEPPD